MWLNILQWKSININHHIPKFVLKWEILGDIHLMYSTLKKQ